MRLHSGLGPRSLFLQNKLNWIHEGPSKSRNQLGWVTGCAIGFYPRLSNRNLCLAVAHRSTARGPANTKVEIEDPMPASGTKLLNNRPSN